MYAATPRLLYFPNINLTQSVSNWPTLNKSTIKQSHAPGVRDY